MSNPREIITEIQRQEEQEIEKEAIPNLSSKLSLIPKEILLTHFLGNVKQFMKQEKKRVSEKMH